MATTARDPAALATTRFVQPVLLACDVAAFRVLAAEGASFVGVAGHSLGEFAALVAAEVLSLADALDLVVVRAATRCSEPARSDAGRCRPSSASGRTMRQRSATRRSDDVLLVANENSPAQVAISGSVPAIERAEALAKNRRIRAVRLSVAGAFHSPLMEPARAAIDERIDATAFSPPRLPIAENVTGTLVTDAEGFDGS